MESSEQQHPQQHQKLCLNERVLDYTASNRDAAAAKKIQILKQSAQFQGGHLSFVSPIQSDIRCEEKLLCRIFGCQTEVLL